MFPALSDLLRWLTGLDILLPLQTFGTMIAIAFAAAYWAYRQELKRKEQEGWIKPVVRWIHPGRYAWYTIAGYSLLACLIVAKGIAALVHYRSFAAHPTRILLSGVGYWTAGSAVAILTAVWLLYKQKGAREKPPIEVIVHPYQIMPSMLWWCGIAGLIGAVLFHKLEHLPELAAGPWQNWFEVDGFTYYGGLLPGIAVAILIAHRHHIPIIHMLDMGSPAMLLAYGIGRLGCHLSGDGDWGMINNLPQPAALSFLPSWTWAYHYPQSDQPVFPTSLYEGMLSMLLFTLLWSLRRRITTPGRVFAIYALANGTERLLMEQIKINPVALFGLTQASLIALLFILTGIGFFLYTLKASRAPQVASP